jgi:hypothetical protein
VTAELKADEIFKPNTLAKQDVVNNTNQNAKVIPWISRITFPTMTKVKVCIADRRKRMDSFEIK